MGRVETDSVGVTVRPATVVVLAAVGAPVAVARPPSSASPVPAVFAAPLTVTLLASMGARAPPQKTLGAKR